MISPNISTKIRPHMFLICYWQGLRLHKYVTEKRETPIPFTIYHLPCTIYSLKLNKLKQVPIHKIRENKRNPANKLTLVYGIMCERERVGVDGFEPPTLCL